MNGNGSKRRVRAWGVAGVLAIVGLVLAGGALAASQAGLFEDEVTTDQEVVTPDGVQAPPRAFTQTTPASQAEKEAVGALAVLQAGSGIPSQNRAAKSLSSFGRAAAMSATVATGEGDVSLAEADGMVCVADPHIGTCGTVEELLNGAIVAVEICGPELPKGSIRIVGVVPDGVSSARPESSPGTAVEHNVYAAIVRGAPEAITLAGRGGARTERLPVPAGYAAEGCE
jgi:hypothetical protein